MEAEPPFHTAPPSPSTICYLFLLPVKLITSTHTQHIHIRTHTQLSLSPSQPGVLSRNLSFGSVSFTTNLRDTLFFDVYFFRPLTCKVRLLYRLGFRDFVLVLTVQTSSAHTDLETLTPLHRVLLCSLHTFLVLYLPFVLRVFFTYPLRDRYLY